MNFSRWNHVIKNWIIKQSQSKPAQIILSVAAGGSLASGMYFAGDFFASLLPASSTAFTVAKAIEYILIFISFTATTIIYATENNQLIERVKKNSAELEQLKPTKEVIKNLQTVASILTKLIPDRDERERCEQYLDALSGQQFHAHSVEENHFDIENPDTSNSLHSDHPELTIEMLAIDIGEVQFNPTYGSLFHTPSPRNNYSTHSNDDEIKQGEESSNIYRYLP
ncbi:MAG: hypothetical protein P4M12_07610 [Gammaproteobacteria bacterium]|nr:hypothetical protein [Gammaproteobacteria bacterium]